MPKFSFDIAPSTAETTLKEVFAYLRSKERRVVVAIDEFQQIAKYPEKGIEALLRSEIQFLLNVRLEDQELIFHDLLRSQSEGSQIMLRAIANALVVPMPTSGAFVASSGLRAASSVAFALKDLKNRDLVYETDSGWTVYDRLFGIWLRRKYL